MLPGHIAAILVAGTLTSRLVVRQKNTYACNILFNPHYAGFLFYNNNMITESKLNEILPYAKPYTAMLLPFIIEAMQEYRIDNKDRIAGFIAACGAISNSFRHRESGSSGQELNQRFDLGNGDQEAISIARTLGISPGEAFKPRGLIHIRGFYEYRDFSIECLKNEYAIKNPQTVSTYGLAAFSSAWKWNKTNCNTVADEHDTIRMFALLNNGSNNNREEFLKFNHIALDVL